MDCKSRGILSTQPQLQKCQLTLKSVNLKDAGKWICELENNHTILGFGQKVYGEMTLKVIPTEKIKNSPSKLNIKTIDLGLNHTGKIKKYPESSQMNVMIVSTLTFIGIVLVLTSFLYSKSKVSSELFLSFW